MRRGTHGLWLIGVAACLIAGRLSAQPAISAARLSDEHVRKAIAAIVEEIYSRKNPQRIWDPERPPPGESKRQSGGYTALTVLALLYAGETYQHPRLRDAVEYLAKFEMEGTYSRSVRASVWSKLPQKFHDKLKSDTQWLLDGFNDKTGGWDYDKNPRSNYHDNSIRQFGALALWEAAKRGTSIDRSVWTRIEDAYINGQLADGGWNYRGEGEATGSMTAAGLATLFITQDLLHSKDNLKLGAAPTSRHLKSIAQGMKWMDENFSASENPGKPSYFYYYLYGVERVGLASGYKYFGSHDWYREGTVELIQRLCEWDEQKRSFTININTYGDGRRAAIRIDDLAFALMFLSRGRVPVAINKLEFAGVWNNRPRDVANLVNWLRESTETDLNWQIVTLAAPPEDWLDAPLLYVASHEALPWMKDAGGDHLPAELEKVRSYLDLGGIIFAVNEGPARHFAESVEKAGTLMYPTLAWRNLPEDHWAYTLHSPLKAKPVLRGLSNGVRDLIILSPASDLSQTLQVNDLKDSTDFAIGENVYFYASEMNQPRPRLPLQSPMDVAATQPQSSATIVRAVHGGLWNPEPQALSVFSQWLANNRGVAVNVIDHALEKLAEVRPKPSLAIICGIDSHEFTLAEIAAIKSFVQSGGVILYETPGGRGGFTQAAEQLLSAAFNRPVQPLLRSRVVTGDGLRNATNLTRLEYRPYALQQFGSREIAPRLRGISLTDDGQPQILFSREDISFGLLDQPRWGIAGYSPQSARELLANIVQHAMAMQAATDKN